MVVATRTQTGTIEIPKYDYLTLRLKGVSQSPTSPRQPSIKKTQQGRNTGVRKTGGRVLGHGHERRGSRSNEKRLDSLASLVRNINLEEPPTPALQDPHDDSPTFWPPVVFGDYEEEGHSPIARADHRISQWQAVLDSHMANMPDPKLERHIKAQLDNARKKRESLEADPDNHNVVNESMQKHAILDRISVLQTALASARFEPERENIRGAIAAYTSGQLGYSKVFTLFWAGKMVDEANSYMDFTKDRTERLDRYAAEYGPHWLWWESPLWIHPDERITALGCQVSSRQACSDGFGSYYLNEGFWKRAEMVHRMPETDYKFFLHFPPADESNIITAPDGKVYCGEIGPRLIFRTILDSGAGYPSLYEQDLWALGIVPDYYGAQSVVRIVTANGMADRRVYEMHVEIAGNQGTVMVDPRNPVNPACPRYIGGLCPVGLYDVGGMTGPGVDANGYEENHRLSGLLPFLAAYTSSTPGNNMILFGENRNDVVGAHKFPAARRWLMYTHQEMDDIAHWDQFRDPMITFSHRSGQVIDEDIGPAKSRVVVRPELTMDEHTILVDPRGDWLEKYGSIPIIGYVDPTKRHT